MWKSTWHCEKVRELSLCIIEPFGSMELCSKFQWILEGSPQKNDSGLFPKIPRDDLFITASISDQKYYDLLIQYTSELECSYLCNAIKSLLYT